MVNKKGQVYLKPKTDVIGNQRKNKLVTYNMQTGATGEVDPRQAEGEQFTRAKKF